MTIRLLGSGCGAAQSQWPPPLSSHCVSWAGPRAAMSRSSIAGRGTHRALAELQASLHKTAAVDHQN
jgi:hypothetical protein